MAEDSGYLPLQQPVAGYGLPGAGSGAPAAAGGGAKAPAKPPAKAPALPEAEFRFFALSTLEPKGVPKTIENAMSLVQSIWQPRKDKEDYDRTKKFEVRSKWSGSFTTVENAKGEFSRIDFPRNAAADKALKLVKDNFANPDLDPVVPVFVCHAAWDEEEEPGSPRDGLLRGFTLVKSLSWFTGERAILLFASQAGSKTLAHELSHWCGFTHKWFEDDRANIGAIGGGGFDIDREQLRKYHRWTTQVGFRKTLAVGESNPMSVTDDDDDYADWQNPEGGYGDGQQP